MDRGVDRYLDPLHDLHVETQSERRRAAQTRLKNTIKGSSSVLYYRGPGRRIELRVGTHSFQYTIDYSDNVMQSLDVPYIVQLPSV